MASVVVIVLMGLALLGAGGWQAYLGFEAGPEGRGSVQFLVGAMAVASGFVVLAIGLALIEVARMRRLLSDLSNASQDSDLQRQVQAQVVAEPIMAEPIMAEPVRTEPAAVEAVRPARFEAKPDMGPAPKAVPAPAKPEAPSVVAERALAPTLLKTDIAEPAVATRTLAPEAPPNLPTRTDAPKPAAQPPEIVRSEAQKPEIAKAQSSLDDATNEVEKALSAIIAAGARKVAEQPVASAETKALPMVAAPPLEVANAAPSKVDTPREETASAPPPPPARPPIVDQAVSPELAKPELALPPVEDAMSWPTPARRATPEPTALASTRPLAISPVPPPAEIAPAAPPQLRVVRPALPPLAVASPPPLPTAPPPLPETRPAEGASRAKIVRSFTSGDITYTIFADGSITADTPTGMLRFNSFNEMRAFVDRQSLLGRGAAAS